jgi:ABC-type methionine transport system ATPase subunit
MGPDESDELGDRLLVLRKEFGLTILVIEHHVPLVLRVCDHVYVLNFGRLLAEGKPDVIQSHPEVVAAYLGGEAPEALAATQETEEDAALDAQLEAQVHGHDRGAPNVDASDDEVDADAPTVAMATVTSEPAPASGRRRAASRRPRTAAEQRADEAAPKRRSRKASS